MINTLSKPTQFTFLAIVWFCTLSLVMVPSRAQALDLGSAMHVETKSTYGSAVHKIATQVKREPVIQGAEKVGQQQLSTTGQTTTPAKVAKSCGSTLSGQYQISMKISVDSERQMCSDGKSYKKRYVVSTMGRLCTNGVLGSEVVLRQYILSWLGGCPSDPVGGASCGTHASGTSWESIIRDTSSTVCVAPLSGFQDCTSRTVYTCRNGAISTQSSKTCSAATCSAPKSCGSYPSGATWNTISASPQVQACDAPLLGNKTCMVTTVNKCTDGVVSEVNSRTTCNATTCRAPLACGDHASGTTWHSVTASPKVQSCDAPQLGNKTCTIDTVSKCTDGVVSVVSSDTSCSTNSCRTPLACGNHASGSSWETIVADTSPPACASPLIGNQTCSIKTQSQCNDGKVTVVSADKTCNTSSCAEPKACGDHASGTTWDTVTNDPSPPYCELPLIGKQTCSIRTVSLCTNGVESIVSTAAQCNQSSCSQPETPLSSKDAQLLLVKTGFQPTQAEKEASGAFLTRRAAVNALVAGLTKDLAVAPPTVSDTDQSTWWVKDTFPAGWGSDARFGSATNSMRSWYVSQMIASPSPLTERLILFWHNHFTTAVTSKEDVWYGFKQHQAIRANYDNYATLLSAMVKNPAMLWYLDQANSFATPAVVNSKGVVTTAAVYPSANFARELLELFTLGEGNYTEQDVTVASYALTGLSYSGTTGLFFYNSTKHYNFATNWANIPEPVALLGQKVDTPDDVVRVLLTEPKHYAATRVVTKLWKEFVSSTPDMAKVEEIAVKFQDPQQYNYDIKPVLVDLFMTDDFWNARGTLVKSPIEYVVGAYRELGLPVSGNLNSIVGAFSSIGQQLLDPPSVQGYLGGTQWINTYSIARRQAYASAYGSQWGTEVFGSGAKLPQITDYESFISPRITTKTMLNPPTNRYISIVEAQQQVLSDPAYSLK